MSYKEWEDLCGFLRKEWRNELGQLHRDSGPAIISYDLDGSIECEVFYISGKLLGSDKEGFWALWEILDEDGRQAPDILKYLARFS